MYDVTPNFYGGASAGGSEAVSRKKFLRPAATSHPTGT